jgi:uncharacterized membrane protein YoaK (UPF0700 family)
MARLISSPREGLLPLGLACVAGYVDTVGFVALFGVFTAHVTGNFVLIGSELTHASGNVLLKLLVFPAFVAGVALARVAVLGFERQGRAALPPMLMLQASLLGGFMLLGWAASPIHDTSALLPSLAGITGAVAMGIQNAVGRLLLPAVAPTTVMTGNVTQVVIDAVDRLRGAADAVTRQRAVGALGSVAAFGAGAIAAAFFFLWVGFASLLLPMVILAALVCAESASHHTTSS